MLGISKIQETINVLSIVYSLKQISFISEQKISSVIEKNLILIFTTKYSIYYNSKTKYKASC